MNKKIIIIVVLIVLVFIAPLYIYMNYQQNLKQLDQLGFNLDDSKKFSSSGSNIVNDNYELTASIGILHGLDLVATYVEDGNTLNYASYYQNENKYYAYFITKGEDPKFCETDPNSLSIVSTDLTCLDYATEISDNEEIYNQLFNYIKTVKEEVV